VARKYNDCEADVPLVSNLPIPLRLFCPFIRISFSMSTAAYLSAAVLMERESAEIARGLRRRDPDVLDGLIEQFQSRLLRYLLYLTGNRALAEDLFQETWIRVLERGSQYNGRTRFETWLFAVARHLVIDFYRRRTPASLEALTEQAGPDAVLEIRDESGPSPFEMLAGREDAERIGAALERLPAVYREVLVLRFQEDMKLEEIAAVTDAPLSTVKSRLHRGLEALRPAMAARKS
jgi:RNA polymerase sigma-70 factor (ECF subfamily)